MRVTCILAGGEGAALAALRAQTHGDVEVLALSGPVGAAWNAGLAQATGQAVMLLTARDILMPWAVAAMAAPGADLVLARRLPAPGPQRPDPAFDALAGLTGRTDPRDPDFGWHGARAAVLAPGSALRLVSMDLVRRAGLRFLQANRHPGLMLEALALAHARSLAVVASACATGCADPAPVEADPFAPFDAPACAAVTLAALGRVLRASDARLRPALVGAVMARLRAVRQGVAVPLRRDYDALCAAVCADAPAVLADIPRGEALGPVADRAALDWFLALRQGRAA
jgi:hypothetical protein